MIFDRLGIDTTEVLVLGITFKENCPDIRNTRVVDVVRELAEYGCEVFVHDPWADPEEVRAKYGLEISPSSPRFRRPTASSLPWATASSFPSTPASSSPTTAPSTM